MARVIDGFFAMPGLPTGDGDTLCEWGSLTHASTIRAAVLLTWLVEIVRSPYDIVARLPTEMIEPYGAGHVLLSLEGVRTSLLTVPGLIALKWISALGCVVCLLRPRAFRCQTAVVFVSVLMLDLIAKAAGGFANHAQAASLFVLFVFVCFEQRPFYSIQRLFEKALAPHRVGWPISGRSANHQSYHHIVWLTSLMITLPYTYIGLTRLVQGGWTLFTGNGLLYYLATSSRSFESYPAWFNPVAWWPALLVGFMLITLCEALSALTLVSRRFRLVWLLVMVPFHVATMFLMNILFWQNAVLLLAIFAAGVRVRNSVLHPFEYRESTLSA